MKPNYANTCKLKFLKNDTSRVLITFGNNATANFKMIIVSRTEAGGYILRHNDITRPQDCLYVVDSAEGWSKYHVIPNNS